MSTTAFGDRLKKSIRSAGLKQKDLAHKLGVSESSISAYIKGDNEPSLESLNKISEVLNESLDWLIAGRKKVPYINETVSTYGGVSTQLSSKEETVLGQFRKLKEEKQTEIVMFLAHEVARDEIENMS